MDLPHFHIRWFPSRSLDWQRFDTKKEAEERAAELVLPGERYRIETVTQNCKMCAALVPRCAPLKKSRKRAAG
jgi:hypothetical protein